MSNFLSIKLITSYTTHLWEDSLFFLEKAVELAEQQDTWHVATYLRGCIYFSATAFEGSCADICQKRKFSNHIGVLKGIKKELRENHGVSTFDPDSPYWKNVQEKLNRRNAFTHRVTDQAELLQADIQSAADIAVTFLKAMKEIYKLFNKPVDQWIDEYQSQFERYLSN